MKKTALIIAAVFASLNIFAQGLVTLSNLGLNAPVITGVQLTVGTVVIPVGGNAPAGTTIMVALYWAPYPNPDPGNAMPPPDSAFSQVGASAMLLAPGIYSNGSRTAPLSPPGYLGWFEVKAWSAAYGQTWEAAYNAGLAGNPNALVGISSIIKVDTGDPTSTPAGTPTPLKGISGITLLPVNVVPEPAIIGLGLLGGAALLLLRRRK